MLSEQFINLCAVILLSNNPKFTKDTFTDIHTVLNFYKEDQIPLNFKAKLNLCKTISKLKIQDRDNNRIVEDIILTQQFKELESFLTSLPERTIEDNKIDGIINQLKERKKYIFILKDIPQIENFVKQFNTNSFSDLPEALKNWEAVISQASSRITEEKRRESYTNITNIDLYSDVFDTVLNQIELSYSGKNAISTGYRELDGYMNGGFEPSRLYIFGGSSGDGKSVLLMNFLKNGVESLNEASEQNKKIFIYFTLENLIDESFVRLYCCLTDQSILDVMKNFDAKKKEIETTIKNWQMKHNSIIIMSYFPPTLTSVSDLTSFIDKVEQRYKDKGSVKAIYVDYLDLLKSGQTFDLYRLEQGQVTIDLKVLAVMKHVPVLSVTQLNRSIFLKSRINIKGVGDTTFDQVKIGDYVKRGKQWVKVLKIFPKEKKKCYKIKTRSGKEIICGPKHNFPTNNGLKNIQYTNLRIGDKLYIVDDYE